MKSPRICYLCMEFGLDQAIKSYAGGLGILAGDTIKSAADLGINLIGVTLLYHNGYFKQVINKDGKQEVLSDLWDYSNLLAPVAKERKIAFGNHEVYVDVWKYEYTGENSVSTVYFLDANVEKNNEYWKRISHHLYPGNIEIKLQQEIVLGYGAIQLMPEIGVEPQIIHINESHASLAILPLLKVRSEEEVKKSLIFTTHTPIPAGHEKHHVDKLREFLGNDLDLIDQNLCSEKVLNLTELALRYCSFVNAVSRKHKEVTKAMYPDYTFDYITNGIHPSTWVGKPKAKLFDAYIPEWRTNTHLLRHAVRIPKDELEYAHQQCKEELCDHVNHYHNTKVFDHNIFTIGCARRAATYKRMNLIFTDYHRLQEIAHKHGTIQLIFSGKAHPTDELGQEFIEEIYKISNNTDDNIHVFYMPDYSIEISRLLISGVDLWLNNPIVPLEASGTSGMKASMNGIPNFSTLDGWWQEGWMEGVTGWSIGNGEEGESHIQKELKDLYDKLDYIILPLYNNKHDEWLEIQRKTIAINGSYFSSHRMLYEYFVKGYVN